MAAHDHARPTPAARLSRQPPPSERHIVSEDEADHRRDAATHDALVMLLAYAGLRIGEAFALRRHSIDLAAGRVTISQTRASMSISALCWPTCSAGRRASPGWRRPATDLVCESGSRPCLATLSISKAATIRQPDGGIPRAGQHARSDW